MESLGHLDHVELKVSSVASELEELDRIVRKWLKDHNDRLGMHEQDITNLKSDILGIIDRVDEKCRTLSKSLLAQQESSRKDSRSFEELYEGISHDVAKQNETVAKTILDIHALQGRVQSLQMAVDQLGTQHCPSSALCDQLSRRLDEVIEDQQVFREFLQLQSKSPACNETERRLPSLGDEIGSFSTPTRLPPGLCFLTPGLRALADSCGSETPSTTAGNGTEPTLDVFATAVQRNLAKDFSMQAQLFGSGVESLALCPFAQPTLVYTGLATEDNLAEDLFEQSTTPHPRFEIADSNHCDMPVSTIESDIDEAKSIWPEGSQAQSHSPLFKLIKLDEGFDLYFKPLPPLPEDKQDFLTSFDLSDNANRTMTDRFFSLQPLFSEIHDCLNQLRFSIVRHNWLHTMHTYWLHLVLVCSALVVAMVGHSIHGKGVKVVVTKRASVNSHFWSHGEGYTIQPLEGQL